MHLMQRHLRICSFCTGYTGTSIIQTRLTTFYSALQQRVSAILDTVDLNVRIPNPKLTAPLILFYEANKTIE